jgi:hypothetical protein
MAVILVAYCLSEGSEGERDQRRRKKKRRNPIHKIQKLLGLGTKARKPPDSTRDDIPAFEPLGIGAHLHR